LLIPFANIEASQDFLGVEAFDQTTWLGDKSRGPKSDWRWISTVLFCSSCSDSCLSSFSQRARKYSIMLLVEAESTRSYHQTSCWWLVLTAFKV
jgi:hypothetical protein